MEDSHQEPSRREWDLVIVGGGISGLYCAMKLLQQPKQLADRALKNILVLEKSDRWGGRLETDVIKLKDDDEGRQVIKEEEGAMRFTYHSDPSSSPKSNMPLLSQLIKDLEMEKEIRRFYMEPQHDPPSSEKVQNCNARYFDGKHFTDWYATQNPTLWKNMFNLERDEEFKSAGEIVKDIYRKLLDHNKSKLMFHFPGKAEVILDQKDTQLLQEYENTEYWAFFRNEFTWCVGMQEIPLNKFSMQALLTTMGYSRGCCMMMVQTQGFLCVSLSAGNVGTILQDLITFNLIGDSLYQFDKGWSSLVDTLKKYLQTTSKKDPGVYLELRKKCAVVAITDNEEDFELEIKTDKNSVTEKIVAKHVVMALPPKAAENILIGTEYWKMNDGIVKKICRSVEGIHCTKINLYFDDDWWNQDDEILMFGPNVTSLPCGFVYPFYGDCKTEGYLSSENCDDDPCPAALTIYCDVNNAQFWSSLQSLGHKFQSPLQDEKEKLTPASESVVSEALKQFQKIFNIKNIPHPILTSYRSWDGIDEYEEKGYGYAIHMWGLGVDDNQIMKKVAKPIKWRNLYFCNEAWSGFQGWVEGSLMSTQKVVDKLLELEE